MSRDSGARVDVAVVIALREELEQFLEVFSPAATPVRDASHGGYNYLLSLPGGAAGPYRAVVALVGEMGPEATSQMTEHVVTAWHPRTAVMLGIAAGIHRDIQLGDVVVASRVDAYLATTRARPKEAAEFEFARRGTVFETSHAMISELTHFPVAYRDAFRDWQAAAEPERETLRMVAASRKRRMPVAAQPQVHVAKIASGPVLATSRAFAAWVVERDETLKALDMESAGFAGAMNRRLDVALSLVLRGISDFGDERKRSLDRATAGLVRQYAVRNSARLLAALAGAGVLPRHAEPEEGAELPQTREAAAVDMYAPAKLREVLKRITPSAIPQFDVTRDRLRAAYRLRTVAKLSGADSQAVDAEIIELRRMLRDIGALQLGSIIADGRYELVEEMGSGGYGAVWKAYDHFRDEFVAIKTLQDRWARDESRRRRFFRGARVMWRFSHPNIVRVLEPEGHDGPYEFYVMELIEGRNLEDAVLSDSIEAERGLRAVLDVADALVYAHANGCIHRDIKPSNILLDGAAAKLTDFDLVRPLDTTGGTQTAQLGTMAFCAPEMLAVPAMTDHRSDLCSLGKTAVFVLTGRRYSYERMMLYPHEEIEPLPITRELRYVLTRATMRKPADRFEDVRSFADALRTAIAHGVAAPPAPPRRDDDYDGWGQEATT